MVTFQSSRYRPSTKPSPAWRILHVSSSPAKQSFPPLNEEQNLKGTKKMSRVSVNLVSKRILHVSLPLKKLITLALCFLSVVSNHIKNKNCLRNLTVEPKHVELYMKLMENELILRGAFLTPTCLVFKQRNKEFCSKMRPLTWIRAPVTIVRFPGFVQAGALLRSAGRVRL